MCAVFIKNPIEEETMCVQQSTSKGGMRQCFFPLHFLIAITVLSRAAADYII